MLGTGAIWGGVELLKAGGIIKTIAAQFSGIAESAGATSGILGLLGGITLPQILAGVGTIAAIFGGIKWYESTHNSEYLTGQAEQQAEVVEEVQEHYNSINEEYNAILKKGEKATEYEKERLKVLEDQIKEETKSQQLAKEKEKLSKAEIKAFKAWSQELYADTSGIYDMTTGGFLTDIQRDFNVLNSSIKEHQYSVEEANNALKKYSDTWKPTIDKLKEYQKAGQELDDWQLDLLDTWDKFINLQQEFTDSNSEVIDNVEETTDALSEQADSLINLAGRFAEAAAALAGFAEGTDYDDYFEGFQSAYETFMEDFKAGKLGSIAVEDWVNMTVPEGVKEALGYNWSDIVKYAAGETVNGLQSEFVKLIQAGNPLQAFNEYLQGAADKMGQIKTASGELAVTINEDGSYQIESWSALAEVLGTTEAGIQALRGLIQEYTGDVIISGEEMKKIFDNLGKSISEITEADLSSVVESVKNVMPEATAEQVANVVAQIYALAGITIDPKDIILTVNGGTVEAAQGEIDDLTKPQKSTINITTSGKETASADIQLVYDKTGKPAVIAITQTGADAAKASVTAVYNEAKEPVGIFITDNETGVGVFQTIETITAKNGEDVAIDFTGNNLGDIVGDVNGLFDSDGKPINIIVTDNGQIQIIKDNLTTIPSEIPVTVKVTISQEAQGIVDTITGIDFTAGSGSITSGVEEAGRAIGQLAASWGAAKEAIEQYGTEQQLTAEQINLMTGAAAAAFGEGIMAKGKIEFMPVLPNGKTMTPDEFGAWYSSMPNADDASLFTQAFADEGADVSVNPIVPEGSLETAFGTLTFEPPEVEVEADASAVEEESEVATDAIEGIPEDHDTAIEGDASSAIAAADEAIAAIAAIPDSKTITISGVYTGIAGGVGGNKMVPRAHGVKSSQGEIALVNDGSPVNGSSAELIVDKGRAFIAGGGKETIVPLSKGATVYSAAETQQILQNSKGISTGLLNQGIPSHRQEQGAGGVGKATTPKNLGTKIPLPTSTPSGGGGGGGDSGDKSKSSSSSSSSKDPWKEEFENWLKERKHLLAMDLITEKEYYDSLEEMYKKYFSDLTKYQDEYWKYEEEVYKYRKQELEDTIKLEEALSELAKAKTQKVLVYKDGHFQYMQNIEAIARAQQEVNSYANGTTNAKAGLDLVGENGPELRVLNHDGIIPADITKNLLRLGTMSVGSLGGLGSHSTDIFNIDRVVLENVNNVEDIFSGLKNLALQRATSRI